MNILKKICLFCLSLLLIYLSGTISASASVLSNDKLTVSVGNEQSWSGRNGTGNLSYYGCDRQCNCVYLTGGKITCRNGVCSSSWQYKNTIYTLNSPITSASANKQSATTLTISDQPQSPQSQSDKSTVIQTEQLYPRPFDNLAQAK